MKTTVINGVNVNLPVTWDEVTLDQFIKFANWLEKKPSKFDDDYEEYDYGTNLIEVFSGDTVDKKILDSFKMKDISPLIDEISLFIKSIPSFERKQWLVNDDILYAFVDFENISKGEYIAIKQMCKIHTGYDGLPYLLSVICRPATKSFNVERKEDVYILEEFNPDDITWRSNKFRSFPAIELMGAANFFLSGNKTYIKGLMDTSTQKGKLVKTQ